MNRKKGKKTKVWWAVVLLMGACIIAMVYQYSKNEVDKPVSHSKTYEPLFVKEGVLHFLDSTGTDTISHIEIADDSYSRTQGLMYRRSMPDSVGMLFVFEEEKPQGFWMLNTYFSLDIIYINSKLEIVSIQKYTKPFSKLMLPSKAPAMYVVEVNAGYCYSNGIKAGFRIAFALDKKWAYIYRRCIAVCVFPY